MEGSFISETRRQATDFYRDLVQGLVPPQVKAPKIREDEQKAAEPSADQAQAPEKSERETRQEHAASLQRLAQVMPFAPH